MKDNYPEFDSPCLFGPPSCPGVYAIFLRIIGKEALLYIGSSKNIKKRMLNRNHIFLKLYDEGFSAYCRFIETENYKEIEKTLIKKYKPSFNKQHKS